MAFEEYIKDKKAFIFGLDDIIYPEKDYLLQVYYLFSEFLSYTEQLDSSAIINFMKAEYETFGAGDIFDKTAENFNIPLKYKENFLLLHQNARLPLKLLLYGQVLLFLQEIVVERKEIFLMVNGDPIQQLNKIKQLEWNGLEKYLKVYFTEEFDVKTAVPCIDFIVKTHHLNLKDILLIGNSLADEKYAIEAGFDFLSGSKLT